MDSDPWSDELVLAEAVEKCADINSLVMIKGRQLSQLMVACYYGNMDYLLKDPGVTVDLQNNAEGQHALLCACEQGHTEIAQLILNTCQHPKDVVNLQDKKGRTPPAILGTGIQSHYCWKVLLMLMCRTTEDGLPPVPMDTQKQFHCYFEMGLMLMLKG